VLPTDEPKSATRISRTAAANWRASSMDQKPKSIWRQLNRGWRYWTGAVLTLIVGMLASAMLDRVDSAAKFRYEFFQRLAELDPREIRQNYIKRVMIGDEEYWKGSLEGRRPIKRSYLAELLSSLHEGNPKIIALDFDLRLPDPAKVAIPATYFAESEMLARTVLKLAENTELVLPATIRRAKGGGYAMDPSIFQVFGICNRVIEDGTWIHEGTPAIRISEAAKRNIVCGYIEMPYDMRMLPPALSLAEGGVLDSFSLAIAKMHNPRVVDRMQASDRFASFIRGHGADPEGVVDLKIRRQFSASEIKDRRIDLQTAFKGQIVIVGGDWRSFAAGRGPRVDSKATPVGSISGAMVHSNYVEALLDDRTYPAVSHRTIVGFEAVFGLLASLLFALCATPLRLLGAVIGLSAILIAIQWGLLNFAGIIFEAFVPLFSVWLHSFLEPWAEKLLGEDHKQN
jgi:CHASE2 domain-containing sensor protein